MFMSLSFFNKGCETVAGTPYEAKTGHSISTFEVLRADVKSAKTESLATVDGCCRADMEVMIRWDQDSGFTTEHPVIVSFNTLFGCFRAPPVKKSGDYWFLAVNQVADKSKPEKTTNSVDVRIDGKAWNASMAAIWVDMSVDYNIRSRTLQCGCRYEINHQ